MDALLWFIQKSFRSPEYICLFIGTVNPRLILFFFLILSEYPPRDYPIRIRLEYMWMCIRGYRTQPSTSTVKGNLGEVCIITQNVQEASIHLHTNNR